MEILLATSNEHKLREAREILDSLGVQVLALDSLDETFEEPEENADTFQGNARLKALGYAIATNIRVLADDSGLSVDYLEGRPGVHSARFAGSGGTRADRDQANNELLLHMLKDVPQEQRAARFVCAMCIADPDGSIIAEEVGTFEGTITESPKGDGGFGYDSLLFVEDVNKTSAEMSSEEKNARSHRGNALRAIAKHFAL